MTWDEGLSEEQKLAASHLGAHACLLAGPGTGKTLSLTKRVLYLVEERGIPPSEILAVTFTRAATAELKKNLKQELGEGAELPHISTLHSFALRTILQNPTRTALPQPIRIADDYEERWIIQEELRRILGLRKVSEVAQLINQLSADWEQLRADAGDWESRFPNPQFLGAWREHRRIYGYTLRAELVYQLKLSFTEGGLELPNAPRYLLVDEYQDLNACDLAVIKCLSEAGAELFGAGDDDQSIYGFRYANPEGIRRFEGDYAPSQLLELTVCKRCDRDILDLGLFVARQDPRRLEKPLYCEGEVGPGIVKILRFPTQAEEADSVATICRWLIERQDVQLEEILVLFRTDRYRRFSDPIRVALESREIRVATVANPLEPLNCPKGDDGRRRIHGRYFLCLLRLLTNRDDHLGWRTILQLRANNLGTATFQGIYELGRN